SELVPLVRHVDAVALRGTLLGERDRHLTRCAVAAQVASRQVLLAPAVERRRGHARPNERDHLLDAPDRAFEYLELEFARPAAADAGARKVVEVTVDRAVAVDVEEVAGLEGSKRPRRKALAGIEM